jgi:hypothetical protein
MLKSNQWACLLPALSLTQDLELNGFSLSLPGSVLGAFKQPAKPKVFSGVSYFCLLTGLSWGAALGPNPGWNKDCAASLPLLQVWSLVWEPLISLFSQKFSWGWDVFAPVHWASLWGNLWDWHRIAHLVGFHAGFSGLSCWHKSASVQLPKQGLLICS